MTTRTQHTSVSRTEFESFTTHVEQRFDTMGTTLREIATKLDSNSRPRYEILIGVLSLIVSVVAGAAFVVSGQITSLEKLAVARDEALQQRIAFQNVGNNRYTLSDHRGYENTVDERFDEFREDLTQLRNELHMQNGDVKAITSQLNTWVDELKMRGNVLLALQKDTARLIALQEVQQ